jgi:hypothetical protein
MSEPGRCERCDEILPLDKEAWAKIAELTARAERAETNLEVCQRHLAKARNAALEEAALAAEGWLRHVRVPEDTLGERLRALKSKATP